MNVRKSDKCRLCFSEGIFHINIFDTTKNTAEVLQEIFHSEVNEYDSLPNHICVDCWMTTQNFYKFYRKVVDAQKFFLTPNRIVITSVKTEIINAYDNDDEVSVESEFMTGSKCEAIERIEVSELNVDEGTRKYSVLNQLSEDDSTHFDELDIRDRNFNDENGIDMYDDDDDDEDDETGEHINGNDRDNDKIDNGGKDDQSSDSEYQDDDDADEDFTLDDIYMKKSAKSKGTPYAGKRKRGRPRKEVKAARKGPRGTYKCPYCVKWFTRRHRVDIHCKLKHGHQCDLCDYRAATELKLKRHKHTHDSDLEAKLQNRLEEVNALQVIDSYKIEDYWNQFDMKCDNCPVEFQSLAEAQSHYVSEHQVQRGYIKCCDLKLREETVIREHISFHSNPELYSCFVCETTIKLKSHLRTHLKNHMTGLADSDYHICDICFKAYSTKTNLLSHKAEVHTHKAQQIKCDVCSKVLHDQRQKEKHMRNAHETMTADMTEYMLTNFNMGCDGCDVVLESFQHAKSHYESVHNESKGYVRCCEFKLKSLREIYEHITWHQNPDAFKCHLCGHTFKQKHNLKTHIHRHNGSFTCDVCGKSFNRRTGLNSHMKHRHRSEPRNIQCRFCSLRFVTDDKRDTHEQIVHYGNTMGARSVCEICGRGFMQTCHLSRHMEKHHSGKDEKKPKEPSKSEKCTICGLWLSSRYRLKLHRKSHSVGVNRCEICGIEAPNHDALLGHVRAFHEVRNKNKCRLCLITFETAEELQNHIISAHPEEKLHRCHLCMESFVWKVSVDAHMKRMHQ